MFSSITRKLNSSAQNAPPAIPPIRPISTLKVPSPNIPSSTTTSPKSTLSQLPEIFPQQYPSLPITRHSPFGRNRSFRYKLLTKRLLHTYGNTLCILTLAMILGTIVVRQVDFTQDYTGYTPNWSQINPRTLGLQPFNSAFPVNGSSVLVADFHTHTTISDGKLSPRELLRYAVAQGFQVITVTDHNTIDGAQEAVKVSKTDPEFKDKILVIPGVEYSCCRIHMNLIGINETIRPNSAFPTDQEIQQAISRTHDLGGLVIVNHIPWSTEQIIGYNEPKLPNHPTRDQLLSWGIDGIEVINNGRLDYRSVQFVDLPTSLAKSSSSPQKLLMVAGSDTHFPGNMFAWNLLNLNTGPLNPDFPLANISLSTVMDALKARNTTFLFDAAGTIYTSPPSPISPWVTILTPIRLLGLLVSTGLYRYQNGQYSFVNGEFCQPITLTVNYYTALSVLVWILVFLMVGYLLKFAFRRLYKIIALRIAVSKQKQNGSLV